MVRYRAIVNGESKPEFDARNDRAAVDATRATIEAIPGPHVVEVVCLDEVMVHMNDEEPRAAGVVISTFETHHGDAEPEIEIVVEEPAK